ncbi:OLC1v1020354C1 [Oldenlandia corymbosa var. corymbosa]|uniref:OLC1v1020354C1 n=1 Tax=Oldenlandia corymbosa var. corymbosa TaxID=529605 RepID=A0AAV1EGI4_OLDCO|nr:OLC1v1020354C1 [Oldenlandia corymbosa var. corymbosa]
MRVRLGNREISSDDSLWSAYFRELYHGGGDDDVDVDVDEVNSSQRSDFDPYEVKDQQTLNNDYDDHHDDDSISRSGTNISNIHDGYDDDRDGVHDETLVTKVDVIAGVAVILIACFVGILGHKMYDYTNPIVTPEFKVEMASIYAMQINAHYLGLWNVTLSYDVTAGWNVNFAVRNPSEEYLLSYGDLVANVYFWSVSHPLWVARVSGFDQAENTTEFVHLNFARNNVLLEDIAAYRMARDVSFGKSSDFYVQLLGNVTQKSSTRDGGKKLPLDVKCYLDVEFLCKEGNFMALATPTMCKTSSPKK